MDEKEIKILKRARKHALLFIKRNATIRSVSKQTGYGKSTVHLDLHRIKKHHPELYEKVLEKINFHSAVKHIRGGESIKAKKLKEKEGK